MDKDSGILIFVGSKAGLFGSVKTSTGAVAGAVGCSQQTISRKLKEFEEEGLILKKNLASGLELKLAEKGRELLESHYSMLSEIFEKSEELEGIVATGLKEGSYYVGLEGYLKRFQEKLGFKPFPGTLNLKVKPAAVKSFLIGRNKALVEGFETTERSYGSIECYNAIIGNEKCTILFPERSHYDKGVIEVISEAKLREKMRLRDGDKVVLK